ncbi:MAG: alcohol dehydrogenase catalytic domain-containing protein [Planctomycetota bacterium]|jgi:NADPH:quinone reductase-like Zn-dependent oxidoreductase
MRASFIETYGDPSVIQCGEFPDPVRVSGEVLVRVNCAALNHRDVFVRRGEGGRFQLPLVLGSDGVGEVVEADGDSGFGAGDSVAVYPVVHCGRCRFCASGEEHKCREFGMVGGERQGTSAEYVCLPPENLVRLPDGADPEKAVAAALVGLTAWNMLKTVGRVQPGDHVLLLGASAGVGTASIQVLKHLGAVVHAVTSSPEKMPALAALGADHVYPAGRWEFLGDLRKLPLGGVDVVVNYVGGDTWRFALPALRTAGRALTCGAVTQPSAEIDVRQVFYRHLEILGCSMGPRAAFLEVMNLVRDGVLDVPIHAIAPLDQAAEFHAALENKAVTGKLLLRP